MNHSVSSMEVSQTRYHTRGGNASANLETQMRSKRVKARGPEETDKVPLGARRARTPQGGTERRQLMDTVQVERAEEVAEGAGQGAVGGRTLQRQDYTIQGAWGREKRGSMFI